MSIRIVLVDTNHPGNIGASARAMKNMGLRELCLVRPTFFPNADATARAAGADDLLESARVFATLEEAIADCGLVVGTSALQRSREMRERATWRSFSGPSAMGSRTKNWHVAMCS